MIRNSQLEGVWDFLEIEMHSAEKKKYIFSWNKFLAI